jgi:hypothetical protein
MESMPFGSDGWFILSEPKPKDAPVQQSQSLADMDSDVQF